LSLGGDTNILFVDNGGATEVDAISIAW